MSAAQEDLVRRLGAHEALAGLSFEPVEVAEREAVVARLVPPERAVSLWRAARASATDPFWPLLTADNYVHPDIERMAPLAPVTLAEARAARERVVRTSDEASEALDAIARAEPQAEPHDERDSFLFDPDSAELSLVLVHFPQFEAVRPFTIDGEGTCPRHAELAAFLRHFHEQYGAEPLYADGRQLELEVPRPPRDLDALRALARDFFLLSQGNADGYGVEYPARLLRRLTSDRWVVWWYGTF